MGLTIIEMLRSDFFKDFRVIAGKGGIDKQIQGIAILDAPDGYQWTRGKEFVISSGYVFKQHPELFRQYIESEKFKNISGMGIKLDRYIGDVSQDILQIFDQCNIPLIHIPIEPSWMDIMNQLNVLVMNKSIKQFRIGNINPKGFSKLSYQSRKINKILSQMEVEMKFPAMLFDLSDEKAYYSSDKFVKLMENLKIEDFWNPLFSHTKEVLCDNLQIIRYRFIDDKYDKPYSWITIPISVADKIRAHFVIVEATGLIDYFDQFALRIGFLLLQSLYEQMLVAKRIGDIGFEKFIIDIINNNIVTEEQINKSAIDLEIDITKKYYLILLKKKNIEGKTSIKDLVKNKSLNFESRMAIIDENSCLFLIPVDESISERKQIDFIKKATEEFKNKIESTIENITLFFGISDVKENIYNIKRNFERCNKAISIGKVIYPTKQNIVYTDLGVLGWMDIREDEIELMTKSLKLLLEQEELMETLEVYLESKMNYSITAKKLFIHINTVRKRIEDINDLLDLSYFDLENPTDRLQLEILLKIIKSHSKS